MSRLARLYGMMERIRLAELRAAVNAVNEVAHASAVQAAVREREVVEGRAALAEGDRGGWMVAEKTREVAEARLERMALLRRARAAELEQAALVHRASRLKAEQMERVLERRRAAEAVEEGRREQAAADDRFASRLAWEGMRDG